MIKISKGPEPDVLKDNKLNWTNQLLGHISKNENIPSSLSSRYNHKDVKDALKTECRNKCMYCESSVSHVAHEHIEHIKPKAKDKYPELTFEWQNLGLACPVCNMNKGAEYDEALPFINPYEEDPESSFIALGAFIYSKPGSQRAELSKRKLDLNRPELIEKRNERIESIIRLIERYHSIANPTLKQSILDEINIEISANKPYSLCVKSIYNAML